MNRVVVLAFLAIAGVGQASDQLCQAPAPGDQQAPHSGSPCPDANVDPCDKKKVQDVSWFDWALGSHQMPGLHFVDFLELFVR